MTGLTERMVAWLRDEATHPVRLAELARALRVQPSERKPFRRALRRLITEGEVYRVHGDRYAVPGRLRLISGLLRATRRNFGIVTSDETGEELVIPASALAGAVGGDRVVARVEGTARRGRTEGRVIRVLERGRQTVVGRFQPGRTRGSSIGFVVPEMPALIPHVIVAAEDAAGAVAGDIVQVRVTDWGEEGRAPTGAVQRVLGASDAPGVDILAIALGHELPMEFPEPALELAQRLRERGIRPRDLKDREDLRALHVVTIDPVNARDHDDALSVVPLGAGTFEVGVHIANVSYYVRTNSPLDKEALQRGTSVYLVDRAIPMLPEALSSDLCSLVPDQDRLTLSVFLTVNTEGQVRSMRLAQGVIRSRHRLTYDTVQAVFDGRDRIDAETDPVLEQLRTVSRQLRARRVARGSLDFDLPEARVFLDESGVPVDVQRAERWESHRLVEELMLAANEAIGGQATKSGYPFIYRVHEAPDESRMLQLTVYARALGFQVPFRGQPQPAQLQRLLEQKPGTPAAQLLASLTLRSMKQARYHEADVGHFGLATHDYTHFTSPIRRYPDLLVHRLVAAHHLGRGSAERYEGERVRAIARTSSERERVAAAAERDSIALKKARFMAGHLGATFEGTVSDVRSFGVFVRLDTYFIEGLIHVSSLGDDYYVWVEERFLLTGEHTGRRFQVGQRLQVQVSNVDMEERRIDFVLARERDALRRGRPRRKRRQ